MDDKLIFAAVRETLLGGFERMGLSEISVIRAYQPTTQGREDEPAVYMAKVLDARVGHPERKELYRPDSGDILHTETVWYESTFQLMATSEENPNDEDGLTALDIANRAAHILQSDAGMIMLEARGLQPIRITTIRNPFFQNDKGQFEASPSFDLTLTHKQIVESISPSVQSITGTFDHDYKHKEIH